MKNIATKLFQMTEKEKQTHVDSVEFSRDFGYGANLSPEDIALYNAIIQEREEANTIEKLVIEAKALAENAPDGFVTDGDTLLCDIMEKADFQITGLAADIFDIWLKSSDRKSVEKLFYDLTDVEFEDFVKLCVEETARKD